MAHINHGMWRRYQPTETREGIPPDVLYCRRESDGLDFYDFVQPPATPYAEGSVAIAVMWREEYNAHVVGAATYDPTAMFPADSVIIEIDDYTGSDPQADLGGRVYDLETMTLGEVPVFVMEDPVQETQTKILSALDSIMARLDKLEKK